MLSIFSIFLFVSFYLPIYSHSHTFCGSDLLKKDKKRQLVIDSKKKSLVNKTKNSRRKLSDEYKFTPINIIIDNKYLQYQLNNETDKIKAEEKYTLILNALKDAASKLSSLISVKNKDSEVITLREDNVKGNCSLGNNTYTYNLDYLYPNKIPTNSIIIYPRFHDFNQKGKNNILSSASYCYLNDNYDNPRPIAGKIYIEKNITDLDMRKSNVERYYTMIFLHELTHILVFDKDLFDLMNNVEIKTVEILGRNRTVLSSPEVLKMAKRHFGCTDSLNIQGIELENQDYDWNKEGNEEEDIDEYGNHWDARTMLTDYMTSIHYDEIVISEITLALFVDSGWYTVNYFTGGLFRYGKNQGCGFLNDYCINGDKSLYQNEFCITEKTTMCTPGRTHRAMCGITSYPKELDSSYRYFTDSKKGGYLTQTDYCPVAKTNSSISKTYYYQGNCDYGEIELYPENLGYTMGNESICLLSSLTPKDDENLKEYPSSFRALCYKVDCYNNSGEKGVRIFIGNNVIICPVSGGVQTLDGYNGYILCPDFNLICTGSKWCLDPLSCIEENSIPLEDSYIYDYTSSTSQEYQDLLNYKVPIEDKVTVKGNFLVIRNVLFYLFLFFLFI